MMTNDNVGGGRDGLRNPVSSRTTQAPASTWAVCRPGTATFDPDAGGQPRRNFLTTCAAAPGTGTRKGGEMTDESTSDDRGQYRDNTTG